jgi:hypothetical protein
MNPTLSCLGVPTLCMISVCSGVGLPPSACRGQGTDALQHMAALRHTVAGPTCMCTDACPARSAVQRGAARLVKHVPDGGARLVDGRDHGVAEHGQVVHVLHHVQRRKAVQACGGGGIVVINIQVKC